MITPDYARTMAAYNHWQNDSLYTAAATLSDEARRQNRNAFWGSIHGTLTHILWADQIWMSRFWTETPKPTVAIKESATLVADWTTLCSERTRFDAMIARWAGDLDETSIASDLTFYSGAMQSEVTLPHAGCIVHFFNHQTHHRGQVHAMLTQAGAKPDDTDLFMMPPTYLDGRA